MSLKKVCLSILTLFLFLNTCYLLAEESSTKKEVDVKIQNWIDKKEFSTFTNEENITNSFIRKILNAVTSSIKKVASGGFESAVAALIITAILVGFSPVVLPILFLLTALNDLYYINPFATIGLIFDYYALGFQLLCSMFGWYI